MGGSQNQMLNLERVRELENWLERTNTKITQVNGQRKYGGPPEGWDGPAPGARCEVFITHIPRDTYEDVLIPLFSAVGSLWEFRLMMNFSGQNRGFAYAKYGSPITAANAIRLLHGHVIEPGGALCVRHSTEKRQLFMGGLPGTTRHADLLQVLRAMCEGVEMLSLKSEPGVAGMSAVITFTAHEAATSAKKVLMEEFKKQYGLRVTISWLPWVKARPHVSLPPQDLVKVSCGSSALPPSKTQMLSSCHGFCRAVGGPTAPQSPYGGTTTSLCPLGSSSSPMMLLNSICKRSGFGQPHYEISCNHAGSDGYLHFSYKVCILGVNTFKGVIMILPGDNVASTLEEARGVAAQQVLRWFHNWVCC